MIETTAGEYEAKFLVSCAGLQSDRVARLAGTDPGAKIIPFRGEYYELTANKRDLVKALIYPVPNPDFPFLGSALYENDRRLSPRRTECGPGFETRGL